MRLVILFLPKITIPYYQKPGSKEVSGQNVELIRLAFACSLADLAGIQYRAFTKDYVCLCSPPPTHIRGFVIVSRSNVKVPRWDCCPQMCTSTVSSPVSDLTLLILGKFLPMICVRSMINAEQQINSYLSGLLGTKSSIVRFMSTTSDSAIFCVVLGNLPIIITRFVASSWFSLFWYF